VNAILNNSDFKCFLKVELSKYECAELVVKDSPQTATNNTPDYLKHRKSSVQTLHNSTQCMSRWRYLSP